MSVVDRSFNQSLKLEEHAVLPLAGGIEQQGYQCGMLWGAALAAGAQAYQRLGAGPQAEAAAVITAQKLVEAFRARNRHIDCLEITELDMKPASPDFSLRQASRFMIKGGPLLCFSMAARYAKTAFREIDQAFSETHDLAIGGPVSCAAVLARKAGASDPHTVMAAGLAGGIGLSGSGCGALGAAIWLIEMKHAQEQGGKIEFNSPHAREAMDGFMRHADFEFECRKISGRQFANVTEHADYLRQGGCAQIIESLAGYCRA